MTPWDLEVDVAILGSGGAGLCAALAAAERGARVEVFEGAPTVGGTTAVSGGMVWIPAHDRDPDLDLPVADALRYLRAQSLGTMDEELVEVFVRTAPRLIDFLERHTPLRFAIVRGFPDNEPELPGGKATGGRTLAAMPFDAAGAAAWADRLTALREGFRGVGFDVATGQKSSGRGGVRLVLGLLQGLLDVGVAPQPGVRGVELITEDGAVVGVRVDGMGGQRKVRARRGVVLATGGFEWDEGLVRSFLRGPMHGATSPPVNHGLGLRMAMAVGAELGNMSEAWWVPIVKIPAGAEGGDPLNWGFLFERTRPRSVMVNRAGRRFVNEAGANNAIAGPFHHLSPHQGYVNDPAWIVFDSVHLQRYGAFGVAPGQSAADWFVQAGDIESLATKAGIDPAGLAATVDAWNLGVRHEDDPEFHRGRSPHDGWSGDDAAPTPALRTLGPIDTPPYFAVPAWLGALGTKGGPRTDRDGRVRHVMGGTIPGLFAAGNAMAVVMGQAYGGPGGPIGQALVWGHRAGYAAATATSLEA